MSLTVFLLRQASLRLGLWHLPPEHGWVPGVLASSAPEDWWREPPGGQGEGLPPPV